MGPGERLGTCSGPGLLVGLQPKCCNLQAVGLALVLKPLDFGGELDAKLSPRWGPKFRFNMQDFQ